MAGLAETAINAPQDAYLTVPQVAAELSISTSGVYKLIQRDQLPALKLSARRIRITRWALDAYVARLNGHVPDTVLPDATPDAERLRRRFHVDNELTPEAWVEAWKAGNVPDTAANTTLLVRALSLRQLPVEASEASGASKRRTVDASARVPA